MRKIKCLVFTLKNLYLSIVYLIYCISTVLLTFGKRALRMGRRLEFNRLVLYANLISKCWILVWAGTKEMI